MTAPRNQIIRGDALTVMRDLEPGSVDTVVTSPPYFRLRNYQTGQQLGLEPHVDQWVDALRAVAAEARRLLTPPGTFWLNLGDTYSNHLQQGAARKSLLLAPERVALALTGEGWTLRNKIVWSKPDTVPTSVVDRLATKHEFVYLFSRSAHYYFDLDAIRQPHTTSGRAVPPGSAAVQGKPRSGRPITGRPDWLGPNGDSDQGLQAMHHAGRVGHPLGKNPGDVWTIGVSRYRSAHVATYPLALSDRIIQAGVPPRVCRRCRAPWRYRLLRSDTSARRLPAAPTCNHDAGNEPGLVLDPFMGAGTTAISADRYQRDWLGIEINPSYVDLALGRIAAARSAEQQGPDTVPPATSSTKSSLNRKEVS